VTAMQPFVVPYESTLAAYVALAGLYLAQAIVSDVVAIRVKHVPGMPITSGHDDILFRASRALANTNENMGVFLVLSLAAILLGANPWWTNGLAWTFVAARLAHMLAYYADLRLLRSTVFSVGIAAVLGLFALTLATLGGT
jgi:uncharacterized MAPEG superfamily protein